MKNQACMVCHDDKGSNKHNKLKKIQELLRDVEPTDIGYIRFNWSLNKRCKYGLSCNDINNNVRQSERIVTDIENKLVTVAYNDDASKYQQILRLLQGDFPSVYNELQTMHRKNKFSKTL